MCGIFGMAAPGGRQADREAVEGMRQALRHRGPDDSGVHADDGAAIGNARLSIVDLASGHQPIYGEGGRLVIVFNGEIYNHAELRALLEAKGSRFKTSCDTEVILHAFDQWGPDCVQRLNGMYAFAIWDTVARTLFVARDPLGIKPLYYVLGPSGEFFFASEAKALLHVVPGGPRPDWTALGRYLAFGYVPCPDSPFEGVRKFPAGHAGFYRDGRLELDRFFRPEYGLGRSDGPEAEAERLTQALDRAVRLELMGDVPVGVFLSGGLDSSAVALFARDNSPRPVKSFALGFPERTHDEAADARLVAEALGLEHHELACRPEDLLRAAGAVYAELDEPFADSTVVPLRLLSEFARREVKVALTGWGGDELFAGYPTCRAHRYAARYRRLPGFLSRGLLPAAVNALPVSERYMSLEFKAKRFIQGMELPPEEQHARWMGYFDEAETRRVLRPEIASRIRGGPLDLYRAAAGELTEKDVVSRIMHLDALYFLEGNGLFQADRITMAASLEGRVPLLNIDLVKYASALPTDVKMAGGQLKGLLKRVLKGRLPERILNKPKKGFGPPTSAWIRTTFRPLVEEVFSRRAVERRGFLDYAETRRLLDEHAAKKADHGRKIWALLSLQLWYDAFIEPGRPAMQ